VEATKIDKEEQQDSSSQTRKHSFISFPKPITPTPPSTHTEMVERQLKGLCYNCDEKYFPSHKCKEETIFMDIFEYISEEDVEAPPVAKSPKTIDLNPPSNPLEVEPDISLNSLTSFSSL
jgi:hypothetical protein